MGDALAAAAGLLDPERCVDAGAAFGQTALRPPWGGLVVAASRFIEFGCRATALIVPDLFRMDVEPVRETLELRMRGLGPHGSTFSADSGSFDGLRDTSGTQRPIAVNGAFDLPGGALVMQAKLLLVTDPEAGGTHVVARAAIGLPADA